MGFSPGQSHIENVGNCRGEAGTGRNEKHCYPPNKGSHFESRSMGTNVSPGMGVYSTGKSKGRA